MTPSSYKGKNSKKLRDSMLSAVVDVIWIAVAMYCVYVIMKSC